MIGAMKNDKHILTIETSGRIGGAAISIGPQIIGSKEFTGSQKHTSQLFPTIEALCKDAGWQPDQIEQIFVSSGPGSFTGLRVGITAAKVLAYASEMDVVSVPSMDALVLNMNQDLPEEAERIETFVVVMDAKRQQVYAAIYQRTGGSDNSAGSHVPGFDVVLPASVLTPSELLEKLDGPAVILGEGLRWHGSSLEADGIVHLEEDPFWQPRPENVLQCGLLLAEDEQFTVPEDLIPIYLRRPEAVEKWEQLHGTDA